MVINKLANKYIPITEEVRSVLKSLKIVPRESYDDVIRRRLNMPKRSVK